MTDDRPDQPSPDRNLLFGLLALQMDLIDQRALEEGLRASSSRQDAPLGQVLVEQGAMRPARRTLLEALVEEHLQQHGNSAERSLAALDAQGSLRARLQRTADPSLPPASAASPADDPYATIPPVDPHATVPPEEGRLDPHEFTAASSSGKGSIPISRYRILRAHAKGGLGEVFVAEDQELHREVALKEIQDRHADHPDSRNRFLLEAEITGGLEHPGIVPVYGLGSYADGRPYYAMRFIKGDSLKDAIKRFTRADVPGRDPGERTLALRQLLKRFGDVCNALQYAHSRGVLHRDLKPGNIMLGEYGETLVVDWGLAKPLGSRETGSAKGEKPLLPLSASGSALTQMGAAVGTPAYMSPEQAAGKLDELGPAADVYSLGATLYTLLTGKMPFEAADVPQVLTRVQAGDFPRPRTVKPNVPPALEAICLKAMALKPANRYTSPRAIADDIDHWLADEPVSVYPEPWHARGRRWLKRHRTSAAIIASLLLLGVAGLIAGIILINNARMEIKDERDAKEEALVAKTGALGVTIDSLHLSFDMARDLIPKQAQAGDRSREMLAGMEKQYERLLAIKDPTPQARQAAAELRFGAAALRELLGEPGKALVEYEQAIQLYSELAALDAAQQESLARAYNQQGMVLRTLGKPPEAARAFRAALALRQAPSFAPADPREHEQHVAGNLINLGLSLHDLGDLAAARASFDEAVRLLDALTQADAGHRGYQLSLIQCLADQALVLKELEDFEAARGLYGRATGLAEQLVKHFPKHPECRVALAESLSGLGDVLAHQGDHENAIKEYGKAANTLKGLSQRYPENLDYQVRLTACYIHLGELSGDRDSLRPAKQFYELAIHPWANQWDRLVEDSRATPEITISLAAAYQNYANFLRDKVNNPGAALGFHDDAIRMLSPMEANGLGADGLRTLWYAYWDQADDFGRLGRQANAKKACEIALARAEAFLKLSLPPAASARAHYMAACNYSFALNCFKDDDGRRQQCVQRALELLTEARVRGYFTQRERIENLSTEPYFTPIRQLEEFKMFANSLVSSAPR